MQDEDVETVNIATKIEQQKVKSIYNLPVNLFAVYNEKKPLFLFLFLWYPYFSTYILP